MSSPLQLVALGVDVPCVSQARARQRLVGLEQEVEGLHLQLAAAAAAGGDLQTHPRVTGHCWKHAGLGKSPLREQGHGKKFPPRQAPSAARGIAAAAIHTGQVRSNLQATAHGALRPKWLGWGEVSESVPPPSRSTHSKNHSRPFENLITF